MVCLQNLEEKCGFMKFSLYRKKEMFVKTAFGGFLDTQNIQVCTNDTTEAYEVKSKFALFISVLYIRRIIIRVQYIRHKLTFFIY